MRLTESHAAAYLLLDLFQHTGGVMLAVTVQRLFLPLGQGHAIQLPLAAFGRL